MSFPTDSASRPYIVQHEFDNEPTYVVHHADPQLADEDCVAFGSRLPVDARLRLAQYVCDELNRLAGVPQLHGPPVASIPSAVKNFAAGQSTLVISVAGGVVQDVFTRLPAPRVILVDWDTEGSEEGPNLAHFNDAVGKPVFAWVVEMPTSELPAEDCDVSRALAAASIELQSSPASTTGIRDPATLNTFELDDFVRGVQSLLYLDILGDREFWNPDKEWQAADLLDELARLMAQHGLVPTSIADAPL